jgi:hypothetical protein
MVSFKKFLIENKNIFSFPIEFLKNNRGEIGRQGLSAETISGMLTDIAGIDNKNSDVMKALEIFKNNKDAQNKFLSFVEKNPISVKEMPGGEGFHLNDGHHRAYLADYIGQKNIPTNLETVNSNITDPIKPSITDAVPDTSATKTATKAAESIASSGLKSAGKAALKSVPVIGTLASVAAIADRAQAGDYTGAALEAGSEIADWVPGIGTATSLGIQGYLAARDAGETDEKAPTDKKAQREVDAAIKAGSPSKVRVTGPKF